MKKIFLLILISLSLAGCNLLKKDDSTKKMTAEKIIADYLAFEELVYRFTKSLSTDNEIVSDYLKLKNVINDLSIFREDKKDIYIRFGRNLKETFEKKYRSIIADHDLQVDFEFYLPNNILWLKPTMPLGEDIILKSNTKDSKINEKFLKDKTTKKGYEIIDKTIFYSVKIPIYDERGELIGSIKGKVSLENLIMTLKKNHSFEEFILVSNSYMREEKQESLIIKNYILLNKADSISKNELEKIVDMVMKDINLTNIFTYNKKIIIKRSLNIDDEEVGLFLLIL